MKLKVILGVTGSIACYKAADLARRLMESGLDVHVAMTANAEKFVTALTFETLTGNPVLSSDFSQDDPLAHINFSRGARLVVIAPATANSIGKLAGGIADDTFSTMLLASAAPIVIAPAMNDKMYAHPAVQANIDLLKARGTRFINPASGMLACGDVGEGKLADIDEIARGVVDSLDQQRDMTRLKVVVTAGGAREPIDAVRYIGNRSSGKMGLAIAQASALRGADVTLIAGAMDVAVPEGMKAVQVETTGDMLRAVEEYFDSADVLIMAAAAGDYKAMSVADNKVKKRDSWNIKLVKNRDILMEMGKRKDKQVMVGFAAETDRAEKNGREKLLKKNLDMIVINDVSRNDIGFGADDNELTIVTRDGHDHRTPKAPKTELADTILDQVVRLVAGRSELVKVQGDTP